MGQNSDGGGTVPYRPRQSWLVLHFEASRGPLLTHAIQGYATMLLAANCTWTSAVGVRLCHQRPRRRWARNLYQDPWRVGPVAASRNRPHEQQQPCSLQRSVPVRAAQPAGGSVAAPTEGTEAPPKPTGYMPASGAFQASPFIRCMLFEMTPTIPYHRPCPQPLSAGKGSHLASHFGLLCPQQQAQSNCGRHTSSSSSSSGSVASWLDQGNPLNAGRYQVQQRAISQPPQQMKECSHGSARTPDAARPSQGSPTSHGRSPIHRSAYGSTKPLQCTAAKASPSMPRLHRPRRPHRCRRLVSDSSSVHNAAQAP
jgi:hypothetical protein